MDQGMLICIMYAIMCHVCNYVSCMLKYFIIMHVLTKDTSNQDQTSENSLINFSKFSKVAKFYI